jgi:hypothetical protein
MEFSNCRSSSEKVRKKTPVRDKIDEATPSPIGRSFSSQESNEVCSSSSLSILEDLLRLRATHKAEDESEVLSPGSELARTSSGDNDSKTLEERLNLDLTSVTGSDVALIHNLLAKVSMSIDAGDGWAFAACFLPDGTCDILLTSIHKQGHQELYQLAQALHRKYPTCRHEISNTCVSQGPPDAPGSLSCRSYWQVIDGGEIIATGINEDILSKRGGVFFIKHRVLMHSWTKATGHIHPDKRRYSNRPTT